MSTVDQFGGFTMFSALAVSLLALVPPLGGYAVPPERYCVVDVSSDAAVSCHRTLDAATAGASVVLGVEYDSADSQGPSWVFTADRPCTPSGGDTDFQVDLSTLWGLDNAISASFTYNGCWVDHFDLPGYQGDHTGWQPTSGYIGDFMNDRTSSLRWT
jgi:hypothetical protein